MKWVTRERPKTDRIACPWLIKNFIDPDAEFLYVPADQVLEVAEREGAHSYDARNAQYADRARRRRLGRPRRDAAIAWAARRRRGVPSTRARRPPPARALAACLRRAL